jgi:hypothetical protein
VHAAYIFRGEELYYEDGGSRSLQKLLKIGIRMCAKTFLY